MLCVPDGGIVVLAVAVGGGTGFACAYGLVG